MTQNMKPILDVAIEAAHAGGAILLENYGKLHASQISLKGAGDWVTDCDHASEQKIIEIIRTHFPDHSIHAEESGSDSIQSDSEWFIDPLDGTANFVQGIPFFSVSLALVQDEKIQVGVVYDPLHNELFHAVHGQGAWLNQNPIHVSEKNDLSKAMLTTGFPWRSKSYLDEYVKSFKAIFMPVAGARRMGSAALDLSYTACGRFDGFWEMQLKPWDIGAGILILQEAGGVVSDFKGGADYFKTGNLIAANPSIHAQLTELIRDTLSGVK